MLMYCMGSNDLCFLPILNEFVCHKQFKNETDAVYDSINYYLCTKVFIIPKPTLSLIKIIFCCSDIYTLYLWSLYQDIYQKNTFWNVLNEFI